MFKKGQKVWIIYFDDTARYAAITAAFDHTQKDVTFVRRRLNGFGGRMISIDVKSADVFSDEAEALRAAMRKQGAVIDKHIERQHELALRLKSVEGR